MYNKLISELKPNPHKIKIYQLTVSVKKYLKTSGFVIITIEILDVSDI